MAGLLAFDLAPGARRWTTAGALSFTAAERVIHRVHGHAADLGALTQPAALAGPGVGAGAGHDGVALTQALGVQNVPLLAVGINDERDPGAPVGIVLDLAHPPRNAVLVPLEVDLAVLPLVASASMPRRQVAEVVPPAGLLDRLEEGLLGRVAG